MSQEVIDNESNVLINETIQAPKDTKDTEAPKTKVINRKQPRKKNLPYERVIELVQNDTPILTEEPIITNNIETKELEELIKIIAPKPRKTRRDKGIPKNMDKPSEVRDANRLKNREIKQKLQEEYDKKYQDAIVKKAVAIKRNQLKKTKAIESIKEEVIEPPKKQQEPTPPPPPKPKGGIFTFY